MDQYGYIEDEEHKQEHRRLIDESSYLREKLFQGGELLVLQFLKDWLLPHILNMDKPLGSYLMQRSINQSK